MYKKKKKKKMSKKMCIALIQLAVSSCKKTNVSRAVQFVQEASQKGAKIVALPECFNSPYGTQYFAEYAEPIPGNTTDSLSAAAKENKVFIIGGSIPESDGGKLYNTCTVFSPDGELIAKHRKVHLFDIDIPGKIRFQESEILSAGNKLTTFQTPFCKVGIGICYDMRFAEMAQIYAKQGCHLLVYPGAFNMTTGAAHWELLQRGRAIDNQLFVATVSPARDESASYIAWGHSSAVSPWGEVIAKADEKETIVYTDLNFNMVDEIRAQIPLTKQRRSDMYNVQSLA